MEKEYQCLSREIIYQGRIINVFKDKMQLPTGAIIHRELVSHVGGVAILPVLDEETYVFVRQFRFGKDELMLEIPAGIIDPGEEPLETAKRELEEEIGFRANTVKYLTTMYPTPGYCDEELHIYIGNDLSKTKQNLDEHEILDVVKIPKVQARQMVFNGEIKDSKTIIAVLWDMKK